jgi:prevent-host-death family protein
MRGRVPVDLDGRAPYASYKMYERDHTHDGIQVSVSQARESFAELVNQAAYREERVIITRRGRAIAAIVPIEDVAYLERLEDQYDLKVAEEARADGGETIAWEEIKEEFGLTDR